MIQQGIADVQDGRISPKTETILRIIEPDKVVCSGKPYLLSQGCLDTQAAERADVILKGGAAVLLLLHRFKKHQAGIYQPAAVESVNSAVGHNRTGAGKVIRVLDSAGQFFHVCVLDHGVIINNQEPVAGCFHNLFYPHRKPSGAAQIIFYVENFQTASALCQIVQIFS